MSVTGLGMPYMGSKRKLAPKIITHIIKENPNAKYFYDLFGGGGAISFMALQAKQIKEVNYNEYNPAIVELLKHIVENGVTSDMYNWVSREDFNKNKGRTDYIGGLMTIMWSFGNSGKAYLFGKDFNIMNICNNYFNIYVSLYLYSSWYEYELYCNISISSTSFIFNSFISSHLFCVLAMFP